jgi:hypothetical protein
MYAPRISHTGKERERTQVYIPCVSVVLRLNRTLTRRLCFFQSRSRDKLKRSLWDMYVTPTLSSCARMHHQAQSRHHRGRRCYYQSITRMKRGCASDKTDAPDIEIPTSAVQRWWSFPHLFAVCSIRRMLAPDHDPAGLSCFCLRLVQ